MSGQVRELSSQLGLGDRGDALLAQILTLPGVVPEPGASPHSLHEDWPLIEKLLLEALGQLHGMRQDEGRAMADELLGHRDTIAAHLNIIRQRVPQSHRRSAIASSTESAALLKELDVQVDKNDLIREVSIFAERSDIAEEVVRLATHLDHFQEIMNEDESPGRKLEFLVQEMSREANTIGSKAGDVDISRQVVDIKGTLEKIRELVQNVE